jgi:hypothetical protein
MAAAWATTSHLALAAPWSVPSRRRRGGVTTYRSSVHTHLASDALDTVSSGASATHFIPSGAASGSSDDEVLLRLARRRRRRSGCQSRWISIGISDDNVFRVAPAAAQHLLDARVARVATRIR